MVTINRFVTKMVRQPERGWIKVGIRDNQILKRKDLMVIDLM